MKKTLFALIFCLPHAAEAQADNEIQVYASPTIQKGWTIFELHSNYTFRGPKYVNRNDPRWLNETLEITHGVAKNFEIGFYTFTSIAPGGKFMYQGNQIRPRYTFQEKTVKGETFGSSLSLEFGFFRPDDTTEFEWQGELRPIFDATRGNWYFSLNPNIDFVLTGDEKSIGFSPQLKMVYTVLEKTGVGVEIYSSPTNNYFFGSSKEILAGPAIDLYHHPMWEVNAAFLFGLTSESNQRVLKLLLGRRRK